jgi:hypothetical protein
MKNLESHVHLPFVDNKENLNANIQNLELRALVFLVSLLAAVPALDLILWSRWPVVALNKSNVVAIGLSVALLSYWLLIIVEELHYLNYGLGEIVASLCRVVYKVGLQDPRRIMHDRHCSQHTASAFLISSELFNPGCPCSISWAVIIPGLFLCVPLYFSTTPTDALKCSTCSVVVTS